MKESMAGILPMDVQWMIQVLEQAGYEAYAVGGCVRDVLLDREPSDWDITTSATPLQIKELFPRTIDTGLEHGTVTVLVHGVGYEVTTYRVDGAYLDGRHPSGVTFTACLEEDLKRRDFTINAMAYHPMHGLVDLFGGKEDLKNHTIRCVGDANERFSEDALRILRAVRFSAQLGFAIEEETVRGICALRDNLRLISKERIQGELTKLLMSDHPEYFQKLYEYGLTAILLPEFDACMHTGQQTKYHSFSVGIHTIRVLERVRADKVLRYAALLHDFGKPATKTEDERGDHFFGHAKMSAQMAKDILRRLKFDNDTIAKVSHLVRYHDYRFREGDRKEVRRAVSVIGEDMLEMLLELERADALGKHERPDEITQKTLWMLDRVESIFHEIQEAKECTSLKTLAVCGDDLLMLGCPKGPRVGELLRRLLEVVLEDPTKNNATQLLELAAMWLK